ncbi:hypothetical protein Efla_006689 [Eimeria flavescens]
MAVIDGTLCEIIIDTGADLSLVSAALLSPTREYKPWLPSEDAALGLRVQEQLSFGLTAVDYFGERPVHFWAGWPLARAQPVAPAGAGRGARSGSSCTRLAPRAPTSLAAAASTLTPSATAAHAPAPPADPPSSAVFPSPASAKVPGGFLPTLPSPNSCPTTAELAGLQLLLDTFQGLL